MKHLFTHMLALMLMCVSGANISAQNPVSLVDETLTYDVIYKWGFINKD